MGLAIAVLGAVGPSPTEGLQAERVAAEEADPELEKAHELEKEARAHLDGSGDWEEAANLLRKAVDLRPDHDPVKVDNLREAARIAHHLGDVNQALRDAHRAAEAGRRQGHVLAAAEAYLEAAWLAVEVGDRDRATRYLEEADVISRSPYLSDQQRDRLLGRMGEPA